MRFVGERVEIGEPIVIFFICLVTGDVGEAELVKL